MVANRPGSKRAALLVHRTAAGLAFTLVLLSGCRREATRPKVVNPMIDSAEKFVMVYTESLPAPRSGFDAFLEVLSTGQESSSDITDQSLARPGPAEAKEGAVRATGPTAPKDVPEPGRVTVVDTSFPVHDPGTVELTGTVHHVGLEGGFWAITGDNGQKYDPLNLPEELKQAGVKVRLWVRIRKDIATTRMWGLPVQIVRYVVPKSEPKR